MSTHNPLSILSKLAHTNKAEMDGSTTNQRHNHQVLFETMSNHIKRVLLQEKPDASKAMQNRLNKSAPRIAFYLFQAADSLESFQDISTLKQRLVDLWRKRRSKQCEQLPPGAKRRKIDCKPLPRVLPKVGHMPWMVPLSTPPELYQLRCALAKQQEENVRLQNMLANKK